MKTEVILFFCPMDKKNDFPLILNGVLENVLVRAQFSLKLAKVTLSLCYNYHAVIRF